MLQQYWNWSFPSQVACFGFGVLLYFLIRENRLPWIAGPVACSGLILAAGAVAVLGLLRATPFETYHVFAAAYVLLALALSRHPFPLFVNRYTLFAGRVSYSAYILHFVVLVQLVPILKDLGLSPLEVTMAAFVLATPVTLALASVSYRFIERPAIRLGRRLAASQAGRAIGSTAPAGKT
jgi:peptidoglycan/LPS O-acetylase OafA/YrhL